MTVSQNSRNIPEPRRNRLIAIGSWVIIVMTAVALLWPRSSPRTFSSPGEFRDWAKAQGLHVWPETGNTYAVIVSDRHGPEVLKNIRYTPARLVGVDSWDGIVVVVFTRNAENLPPGAVEINASLALVGDEKLIAKCREKVSR